MAIYIGKIDRAWYHTYSKKLRDYYFGDDYVVIFSLSPGKFGAVKIRGSVPLSTYKRMEKRRFFSNVS